MGFLADKKILITGLLSKHSIAYGIAKACHAQGAELAFSYVGERFKDRITEFAADFGSQLIFDCDVGDDAQIERLFGDLSATWPKFDGFVHTIGYAPREAIAGDFLDGLSREAFRIAHDISAYSFPAMAKAALPYTVELARTSAEQQFGRHHCRRIRSAGFGPQHASGQRDMGDSEADCSPSASCPNSPKPLRSHRNRRTPPAIRTTSHRFPRTPRLSRRAS